MALVRGNEMGRSGDGGYPVAGLGAAAGCGDLRTFAVLRHGWPWCACQGSFLGFFDATYGIKMCYMRAFLLFGKYG